MATVGAANIQLFHELKIQYPEVPDEVVSNRMKENGNNKEKCMQALQMDSSKYLFGKPNPPGKLNTDLHQQIQDLNISKSPVTSTVKHHVINQNRDAVASIQSSVSWPPIANDVPKTVSSASGQQAPYTAPVLPTDFDNFVSSSSSAKQIPNINCHSGVENSGTCSPQSTGSPSEGRRAVKVLHMPSKSKTSSAAQNPQSSFVYKIQIAEASGVCTVSPAQTSQTTLFINRNNSNTSQVSPDRISANTNQFSSYNSDQHLNVQQRFVPSGHTSPVPGYPGAQQSSPQGFNRPLFVELTSSGPEGAQTQLRYFPTTPDRSSNASTFSPLPSSNRYGGNNPPTTHYQSYHIPQNQQSAYMYSPNPISSSISQHGIQILSMESEKGNIVMQASSEGRPFYSPGAISPASSHSSLSSESSNRDGTNQRTRSGSMQEETAYIQALLEHQRSRMEKLERDYENELKKAEKLRNEVSQMEANMGERSARRNSFPTLEDINKVRQSNRKVQTDIQLMINELDMYKNGQTPYFDPLREQNFFMNMPTGQRNSIYSKQPPSAASRDSESPPPVPPRLMHIPPAPVAQPPTGSGDSEDGEQWSCSACTLLNHPALNKCECCEMPRVIKGS